jgi:hypothetical protein
MQFEIIDDVGGRKEEAKQSMQSTSFGDTEVPDHRIRYFKSQISRLLKNISV